jgi:hypothetical protein
LTTDSDLSDARLHVGHADIILTICAYPPETAGQGAKMSGACTVDSGLPGHVLIEAARLVKSYARDLETEGLIRAGRAN